MSLQYIIDGYNVINHTAFTQNTPKKRKDSRNALLEFIKLKRLTGSSKNKITVVFDGYPDPKRTVKDYAENIEVIFSRNQSADERIKKEIQRRGDPKNTVVVSDDKEIKFFARYLGAKIIGVEEFIGRKEDKIESFRKKELVKPELTYSQIHRINEELKKIWLR